MALLPHRAPRDRLRVRAWGRRLSCAAAWADDCESARAELYFELDGGACPPWPAGYHDGLVEAPPPHICERDWPRPPRDVQPAPLRAHCAGREERPPATARNGLIHMMRRAREERRAPRASDESHPPTPPAAGLLDARRVAAEDGQESSRVAAVTATDTPAAVAATSAAAAAHEKRRLLAQAATARLTAGTSAERRRLVHE